MLKAAKFAFMFVLFVVLLGVLLVFMPRQQRAAVGSTYVGTAIVTTTAGTLKPVGGASITVCQHTGATYSSGQTCTPAATLYSDYTLSVQLVGNVLQADVNGNFSFSAVAGVYDYQVSGFGIKTYTIYGIVLSNSNSALTNPMSSVWQMILGGTGGSPTALNGPISSLPQILYGLGNGSSTTSILWGPLQLGNDTTKIDVARYTPPTGGLDLYAATQTAISHCVPVKGCTYDYRGYALQTYQMSQDLQWPTGSIVLVPNMTWQEPLNVSVIPPPYGHIQGPNTGIAGTNNGAFAITKLNTSTDYTPEVLVVSPTSGFEIDHVTFGGTTKSMEPSPGPAFPITSLSATVSTTSVTSGFLISQGAGYSVNGTAGQNCAVSGFNGGGNSAVGYVVLNGTNAIGPGSFINFNSNSFGGAAIGTAYSSAPTTATLSSGTASCAGNVNVYTLLGSTAVNGTFTACANHACAGRQAGIHGTVTLDGSGFPVYDSSSTQIFISSTGESGETPTNNYPQMFAPYLTIDGGHSIENILGWNVTNDSFHDITDGSDMGFGFLGLGGCNCYNFLNNIVYGGGDTHGALYLGGNTYSNTFGFLNISPTDYGSEGWASSFGLGLFQIGGGYEIFSHLDIENSKYSIFLNNVSGAKFPSTYFEQAAVNSNSTGGESGRVAFPTLYNAAQLNIFACGNGAQFNVNDLTNNYPNTYCNFDGQLVKAPHFDNFGSKIGGGITQASGWSIANQPSATCPIGPCTTTYTYWVVFRDWNAGACGNATNIQGCSQAIQLSNVSNIATLSTTSYNTVFRISNLLPAVKCMDVLQGATPTHYVYKCWTPFVSNFKDDGSFAGGAYTANLRDQTGDIVTNGMISPGFLGQAATKTWAGTCSMSGGTTCTFTESALFSATPLFFATDQAGVIAGNCSKSGTTVTITAASANSDLWACMMVGNPN